MTKINTTIITHTINIDLEYKGNKYTKITEQRKSSHLGKIKDFLHSNFGLFNSDYTKYFHFDKGAVKANHIVTNLLEEEIDVNNLSIESLKDLALKQIDNIKSKKINAKVTVSPEQITEQIMNKIKGMDFYKNLSSFEQSMIDYDAKSLQYLVKYTSTELLPLMDKYNNNEKFVRSLVALGVKLRDFEENSKESPLNINDLSDLDNNSHLFDEKTAIPAKFNKDTRSYDFNIDGELVSVKIIYPKKRPPS